MIFYKEWHFGQVVITFRYIQKLFLCPDTTEILLPWTDKHDSSLVYTALKPDFTIFFNNHTFKVFPFGLFS